MEVMFLAFLKRLKLSKMVENSGEMRPDLSYSPKEG